MERFIVEQRGDQSPFSQKYLYELLYYYIYCIIDFRLIFRCELVKVNKLIVQNRTL